jgi:HSP90 family molecular chaperone
MVSPSRSLYPALASMTAARISRSFLYTLDRRQQVQTIERFARLLLGYALLAEGSELTDHLGFTEALAAMMADQAIRPPSESNQLP